MTATIRAATLDDLERIVPLFDAYRCFYGRASDLVLARDFLRERMTRGESAIFIAERDGNAIGFTQLYPSFTSAGAARIWILNDLYVEAAARRAGAAGLLLRAAMAHARETGAVKLTLSTAITNQAAQALYERHGWARDADFLTYDLAV